MSTAPTIYSYGLRKTTNYDKDYSISLGPYVNDDSGLGCGESSVAIGNACTAYGDQSIALGHNAHANVDGQLAIKVGENELKTNLETNASGDLVLTLNGAPATIDLSGSGGGSSTPEYATVHSTNNDLALGATDHAKTFLLPGDINVNVLLPQATGNAGNAAPPAGFYCKLVINTDDAANSATITTTVRTPAGLLNGFVNNGSTITTGVDQTTLTLTDSEMGTCIEVFYDGSKYTVTGNIRALSAGFSTILSR